LFNLQEKERDQNRAAKSRAGDSGAES